ncbi:aminotransferase class III-fold pyridoxal phosphate-dependent enzyme, partial [Mesorhizobium sp. M7A.F.Ca.ET.027.03.2.1]
MKNSAISERKNQSISRGVGMTTQIYADRAENSEIWDVEGRRYIDFSSGIAVVNTGHRHPRVIEAVKAQLDRFTHTCHQVVPYESYVRLAERLNGMLPGKFEKKTIFVTTGAEAVENAIKIARNATGRQAVIAFAGGFHGRTFMGMALTGKVVPYKVGFGAMPGDVYHAPFPVPLHGVSVADSLAALDRLFKADVDPARVAAIIIEPVQGEGGFYDAPRDFLVALRKLCDQHGMLLIADEVQTGFARTG